VKIILKDDPVDLMKRKMQSLDVWHPRHLPTADDTTRRVARDRHGKWISCLYIDGHSEKVKPLEMTVYDWGLPAELVDP
jgi:hypothetical protein